MRNELPVATPIEYRLGCGGLPVSGLTQFRTLQVPITQGQSARTACPGVCFATSGHFADLARAHFCNVTTGWVDLQGCHLPFPSGSKSKDIFLALIYFLK